MKIRRANARPAGAAFAAVLMAASLAGLAVFGPLPGARGEVYKSVDAQGNVRYTDVPPPPGQAASTVTIRRQTEAERAESERLSRQFQEQQARRREAEAQAAAQRKALCDRLTSQRTQLLLPGPYSLPLPDGAVLVVTGSKKLELLREVEAQLAAQCRAGS